MNLAAKELATYDTEFQKFVEAQGGEWRKWKYDVLYRHAESFTKDHLANQAETQGSFGQPFSQEDKRQFLGSVSSDKYKEESENEDVEYQADHEGKEG